MFRPEIDPLPTQRVLEVHPDGLTEVPPPESRVRRVWALREAFPGGKHRETHDDRCELQLTAFGQPETECKCVFRASTPAGSTHRAPMWADPEPGGRHRAHHPDITGARRRRRKTTEPVIPVQADWASAAAL